jgi:recombination protein RecT
MSDTIEATAPAAARPAKQIDLVRGALERMKPQLEMALPRHLTADRLLRVAITAVQNTPKLLECDRTSLYGAIMTCAQLGLEPDGVLGQAYLVPFAGKVQFIPGYKGLLSLARNSGDVTSIAAHEIRDNDKFEFDFASGQPPSHTFDIRQPRGDAIAFYAVARFKDGSFHWDMMSREEIDQIRDNSQGYQAAMRSAKRNNKKPETPWVEHYVEMAKKTMVRRIAKYLPMSVQKAAALADSYDIGRHVRLDTHGEIIIDGEAQVEEDPAPIERQQSRLEQFEERGGSETAAGPASSDDQLPLDPGKGAAP